MIREKDKKKVKKDKKEITKLANAANSMLLIYVTPVIDIAVL